MNQEHAWVTAYALGLLMIIFCLIMTVTPLFVLLTLMINGYLYWRLFFYVDQG